MIAAVKEHQLPLVSVPASRNTDGYGSLDAEERVNKSGQVAKEQRQVLRGFIKHPGATTKELAEWLGLDRHMVARRAPQLAEIYLHKMKPRVELGTTKGRREYRWMATALGLKIAKTMRED